MKKEQFDNLYDGEKKVLYCATEDLDKEFLSLAHNLGYEWFSGESLKDQTNSTYNFVIDIITVQIKKKLD